MHTSPCPEVKIGVLVHLYERVLLFWSDRLQIASHMILYPLLMSAVMALSTLGSLAYSSLVDSSCRYLQA